MVAVVSRALPAVRPALYTRDMIILNQVADAIMAKSPVDEIVAAAREAVRAGTGAEKDNAILATVQAADEWVTEHRGTPRRFFDLVPSW